VWGGFAFVPGTLDIKKMIKPPMTYSVSYFDLGGLVLCLGAKPTKAPPWRRDCAKYFERSATIRGRFRVGVRRKAIKKETAKLHNQA